jgi:thiol-disulfide isomerase/thioredoxin
MKGRTASALAIAALALFGAFGQARHPGSPGTLAPEVALPDERGQLVRLSERKGHVVLVDFWASWCPPCKVSFPKLDALYREFHARGLEVLAVNVDERRRDADQFLQAHGHAMPVLFDPKGDVPEAFAVRGMPTSVLVDRAGVIRFTHAGYTEKTVDAFRQEIERLLGEGQP